MKINNIQFKNGIYSINYDDNKLVDTRIHMKNFDMECFNSINFLTENIKDSFWLSADEYLIVIPKLIECMPDDNIIPLGLCRHYITNHMESEEILSLEIINNDNTINSTDLQFSIMKYLNWDV